jgi:hypothetical protein
MGIVIADGLATLELDHIAVAFSIPVVVGQTFHVSIMFHASAFIPADAEGVGVEVAFGCEGELGEGYFVGGDAEGYDDDYYGGAWEGWPGWDHTPEPTTMLLMVTGGLLALRRRRRNLN